jgi:dTDP-4-amino-4,6-dideoxygalactose transaminase
MSWDIPFNRPPIVERELEYVEQAIRGGQTSGDGPFTKRCSALLEETLDVPRVLLTTSCTHALEMAALLLQLEPGDEVIVPSFTFVSTVNAFVLRGATPVFADVRPDTLNLDETKLDALITDRTRAIVPVHYAGVACEMDAILDAAGDIPVVEDNAHGLYGTYRGQNLGTIGCLGTQSFHQTKNFSCGEGGALLINDASLAQRAEIIREKGTNRARFFRGEIDKYTWVDLGSSYLPSDTLAAELLAQLEAREEIQGRRRAIWQRYDRDLADWAERLGATRPTVPEHCGQTYHMYYLLMPSLEVRSRFIAHTKAHSILTVFHYLPLHLSGMGRKFGGEPGDCPVTEDVADRLVRLPMFFNMSDTELDRVVETILAFEG